MGDPASIGGYTVLQRLGQGGMGTVYLVVDPGTGARRALKTLLAGAMPEERARFRREAEAMAAVDDHPHVVRIHSAGEDAGRPFYVMALTPGGDLRRRLEAGPLPPLEVLALGEALADGLAHVHARGVLHRDLKPDNVLFDERGAPRLVDFGLASLVSADRLTATGSIMGTPAYMAPEQAEGRRDLDARTDVYGLGAVLYHALTGRAPFERPTLMATLLAVLEQPPPAPRVLVPGVPPQVEAVVLKAMSKRPADRHASAAELRAALAEARASLAAAPPPRRSRALALTGVAAAGLVTASAVAGLTLRSPGPASAPGPSDAAAARPPRTAPGPGSGRPPPRATLDAPALRRWLLAGQPAEALAHLATVEVDDEALGWAAAGLLLTGDRAAALRWRAAAAGSRTPAARWLQAVASRAQGEPLPPSDPGKDLAALDEALAAMTSSLRVDAARLSALLAAVEAARTTAPAGLRLALALLAQQEVCARRALVAQQLKWLESSQTERARLRELLAAVQALEPGSDAAVALGVLAWAVVIRGADHENARAALAASAATVERLEDRHAWARGLHAAVCFEVFPKVPPTDWAATRRRGEQILTLLEAVTDDGALRGALITGVRGLSDVAFLRAFHAPPEGRDAAYEEALEIAARIPDALGRLHRARVHLARGQLARADEELARHLPHLNDYELRLANVLRFERAVREDGPVDEALARYVLGTAPGKRPCACWQALVHAREGDRAQAEAALREAEALPDDEEWTTVTAPWRTLRQTRQDVAAIFPGR